MSVATTSSVLEAPGRPVPQAVVAARGAVDQATRDSLAIPDAALEVPWRWRGGELDVRSGLYRGAETIEAAAAELDGLLVGSGARPLAAARIAATTVARWRLHGRLAALPDDVLDQVPRPGEWTARETLAHIVDGQRSYGWFTRWWLSNPADAPLPARPSDDVEQAALGELPGEAADSAGSVRDIRARLDDAVDDWGARFAAIPDSALAHPARWSGVEVDVAFRLGRWSSHIAEHTIQLDKTLAWLGRESSEVERIVRQLNGAWGRLEARLYPEFRLTPEIERLLAAAAATLVQDAASTRAAAEG